MLIVVSVPLERVSSIEEWRSAKAIFLLPRFHEYVTSPLRDSSDNKERGKEKERIYRSPGATCSILSTRLSTEIRVICNFTSKRISREMVPPRWRQRLAIDSFFPLSRRARILSSLKFLFCSYPRYVYLFSSPHCASVNENCNDAWN